MYEKLRSHRCNESTASDIRLLYVTLLSALCLIICINLCINVFNNRVNKYMMSLFPEYGNTSYYEKSECYYDFKIFYYSLFFIIIFCAEK